MTRLLDRLAYSTLGLATVLAIAAPTTAEPSRGELLRRIDETVAAAMERDQVPGIAIALAHHGDLLVSKGYGFADLENRVPVTEHTVFRIGSVTKQFTSSAIMKLVEEGRLSLDDRVETYLPEFPTQDFRITVAGLLDHTSGIKGYTEMPEFWEKARLDLSHEQMIDLMTSVPFEFEPGERYQYNNSAYYLAGLVIEKVSGKSYAEYLEESFFEPLGLFETHYLYNAPIIPNRAEGYALEDGAIVNAEPLSMLLPFSAGALGSSAHDLLVWQRALTSGRVVSAASFERMTTPAKLSSGDETNYGLGLGMSSLDGHRKISHGGGINGFLTHVGWYPDDELYVVVLSNSTSANPGPLANQLVRLALELPEPDVRAVAMSEDALERYAGTYDPGRSPVRITLEGGKLTARGQELVPIGDDTFVFARNPDSRLVFEVEGDRAVAVRMINEGNEQTARRVE